MPLADFPNEEMMCDNLVHHDFAEFKKFDKNHMKNVGGASFQILKIACVLISCCVHSQVDDMLENDITKFMADLPQEEIQYHQEGTKHTDDFEKTPFMYGAGEGVNAGMDELEWVVKKDKQKYLGMRYYYNITRSF